MEVNMTNGCQYWIGQLHTAEVKWFITTGVNSANRNTAELKSTMFKTQKNYNNQMLCFCFYYYVKKDNLVCTISLHKPRGSVNLSWNTAVLQKAGWILYMYYFFLSIHQKLGQKTLFGWTFVTNWWKDKTKLKMFFNCVFKVGN